tara:strand:+ start:41 stop:148 length:108 start_codon:yes stop_codon:yes gene_type:complete
MENDLIIIFGAILWGWWCLVQHQKKVKKDEKKDWK